VTIQARDAETKQPIPGAEIHLTYPLAQSSTAPWQSVGATGNDGLAHLRAAPYGQAGVLLDVSAPGYLNEQKNYPTAAVEAIKPAGFFESGERQSADFVVDLYTGPSPEVELVLPDGFRGMVKVGVKIDDSATCPPGQRKFSYTVPPSGTLEFTGPPMLRRVFSPDFNARYANGTPLSRKPQDDEIGFLCLRSEGGYDYFVVGTRAEYEELRRADRRDDSGSRSSGGGKGGGGRGGRRGRGGNQSATDSSSAASSVSP
jgi:hypothetical protein